MWQKLFKIGNSPTPQIELRRIANMNSRKFFYEIFADDFDTKTDVILVYAGLGGQIQPMFPARTSMILSKFTMATRLGNTPWARRKKVLLFFSHIKKVRGVAIFEQRVRKDAYTLGVILAHHGNPYLSNQYRYSVCIL